MLRALQAKSHLNTGEQMDAPGLIIINKRTILSGNRLLKWKYLSACVTAEQYSICQSRAEVILPCERCQCEGVKITVTTPE